MKSAGASRGKWALTTRQLHWSPDTMANSLCQECPCHKEDASMLFKHTTPMQEPRQMMLLMCWKDISTLNFSSNSKKVFESRNLIGGGMVA